MWVCEWAPRRPDGPGGRGKDEGAAATLAYSNSGRLMVMKGHHTTSRRSGDCGLHVPRSDGYFAPRFRGLRDGTRLHVSPLPQRLLRAPSPSPSLGGDARPTMRLWVGRSTVLLPSFGSCMVLLYLSIVEALVGAWTGTKMVDIWPAKTRIDSYIADGVLQAGQRWRLRDSVRPIVVGGMTCRF